MQKSVTKRLQHHAPCSSFLGGKTLHVAYWFKRGSTLEMDTGMAEFVAVIIMYLLLGWGELSGVLKDSDSCLQVARRCRLVAGALGEVFVVGGKDNDTFEKDCAQLGSFHGTVVFFRVANGPQINNVLDGRRCTNMSNNSRADSDNRIAAASVHNQHKRVP